MFEILGVSIHLYGLMIGLGVLVGGWVSAKVAGREGVNPELVWDGLVWVVMMGVIGARAYHVLDYWSYYSEHVAEIVKVWNGGLGIYGGIAGGVIGLFLFTKINKITNNQVPITKRDRIANVKNSKLSLKMTLLKLLDVASLGVPVGQAIGRWGNYFNQELYGAPTSLLWGVYVRPENRPVGMEQFSRFQPLFLYESLLSLVLFLVLMTSYKKQVVGWRIGEGRYLGGYLLGSGLIRLVLEPLRLRSWSAWGIPVAEWVSVAVAGIGIYLMLRKKRLTKTISEG